MKEMIPMIILLFICFLILMNIKQYVEGFVVNGKCGVGLSCPDQMRCINGYCKTQQIPKLPYLTGLSVL
jgi:hypothetical protein